LRLAREAPWYMMRFAGQAQYRRSRLNSNVRPHNSTPRPAKLDRLKREGLKVNEDPIYYLRALLEAPAGLLQPHIRATTVSIIGHFYVRTDSQPNAGAVAHDYCRLQGLDLQEYICLPSPVGPKQVDETNDEQMRAYDLACSTGEAVVLSIVLSGISP
jgi:hypothetical protein